jgi:KDO2-lipid IV(A) lauroyltransferase
MSQSDLSISWQRRVLLKYEQILFRIIALPMALMPAPIAYGLAVLRGDYLFSLDAPTRKARLESLKRAFGDELTPSTINRILRDTFRLRSCERVDVMRLIGDAKRIEGLVSINGLENIQRSLKAGKGVILCSAHFGSYESSISLLSRRGLPITFITGEDWKTAPDHATSPLRRIGRVFLLYTPMVSHHLRRKSIITSDKFSAVKAAGVLQSGELVFTQLDKIVKRNESSRAISVEFLNSERMFLPGAITLAKSSGAPILITLIRRASDWRHQILDISRPISLEGETDVCLRRCVTAIESAVRERPALWRHWDRGLAIWVPNQ